jgi:hypothetical protein
VAAEGRPKVEIETLAAVSRPRGGSVAVPLAVGGISSLLDRRRGAPREQVPPAVRGRAWRGLALMQTGPPAETGLSHG